MEVDDDVEDDDMDFNPLLLLRSPSETSSSLTSEEECEETISENQPSTLRDSPGNRNTGDSALPQKRIPAKGVFGENVPESPSTQLYRENGEVHVNGLGKESLQTEISLSPSVPNSHPLLVEASEEGAISRRTRARHSLANYALEELDTFLQESDDEGNLQNVDAEEEYRKFLEAVLSGGGDDTQACQGGETQYEDENDADFELGIEGALESNGHENVESYENINGGNEKYAHRPLTRKNRPKLSRAVHRHESTKSNVRPILPNSSSELLAPQNDSHNINAPSSSSSVNGAAVVEGFTDEQLGHLHMMIYEHVQLMIQTFSLSVLDPSKQRVAVDIKKMIVELVGYRNQALARRNTIHRQFCFERQHLQSAIDASCESSQCQWNPLIRNPVMSILDVSPLHLALSYLSDVAASVVKHRKSLVDGTAEKIRSRKEPLFASPVLSTGKDANNVSQDKSNNVSTASPALPGQLHPKKTLAATLVESTKKETIALVPFDIARLAQRFYPLFNFVLFPCKPPPAAMVHRVHFTDAEDGLLALGILEHNSDWDVIQKRYLPCKSTHQIYVRQKNRSSTNAPDNPVKEVRRMKNSPLSTEEIQRVEEGLKIFKNDWTSVWKFNLPYRDPAQLQRQWRVATGVQRSYSKSDALKEKRRAYESKRRKRKASMPDSRVDREQEADNDASEGVENDDDLYANAQVTELADGVFVAMSLNHGAADGTTFWELFNAWSEICRSAGNIDISTAASPSRWFLDGCAVPIPLPFAKVEDIARRFEYPPVQECSLRFSSESVKKLKAKANAEMAAMATATISSLQAVLALIWRAVCRARGLAPGQETTCALPVGCRTRLKGMPKCYVGNAVAGAVGKATVGEILGDNRLGWAAWLLNRAVASVDEASVRRELASWPENPSFKYVAECVGDPTSAAVVVTGSPRFDVYGNNFGWGRPVGVRSGAGNKLDGMVTVYEGGSGGGGMELEVCVAPDVLARLVADEELVDAR